MIPRPRAPMPALDRFPWNAGLAIAAYGRTLGIRLTDPKLLNAVRARLPYGWTPARRPRVERLYSLPSGARTHSLYAGPDPLLRSARLPDILDALETDARHFVAEYARNRIFVHAAVVAWNGRAIVIPGRTLSGKTSLAAAFVKAGAVYYSDEYAVLDPQGRVHPYAKPLSIRDGQNETQTDRPVEYFGGRAGRRALPIGMVLVTGYRQGARWRPRPLTRGLGAMSLLANTVSARTNPAKSLHALSNAVQNAVIFKSSRGEAAPVVQFCATIEGPVKASGKSEVKI